MRINHIGMVVKSLEKSRDFYCNNFSYIVKVDKIFVKNQSVEIIMLKNLDGGPDLELITPYGIDSPSSKALNKRIVLNHLAYDAENYDNLLRKYSKKVVRPSMPAPVELFNGGRTFFVFLDGILIEFVEII